MAIRSAGVPPMPGRAEAAAAEAGEAGGVWAFAESTARPLMATAMAAPVVRVRSKFMANSFMSEAFHVARCWLRCLFVGALISSMVEA